MIDTHAHLNMEDFKDDYIEVIRRSFDNGVEKIINVGVRFETSQRAVKIAEEFENVYATVGLHPGDVSKEGFEVEKYKKLAENNKVVAIGETGLDYYRIINNESSIKNLQKEIFSKHIELARELGLPLIMHCRGSKEKSHDAYEDMIKELRVMSCEFRGVIHCFSADWAIAEKFLDLGFYLGFTGIVTFPKNEKVMEVVEKTPLEKILTETDSPYLSPEPYRGKRNEPWRVKFVIEKIAELKGLTFAEAKEKTFENAEKLFEL